MKVDDFAYNVARETMRLLEETQHYKIPEATQKEVLDRILKNVSRLVKPS
ncbi:MAG: hypothetical protein RLZZ303_2161 [Candidatus Hydrogenedentota bacterium]|jgi:hypothetical protein